MKNGNEHRIFTTSTHTEICMGSIILHIHSLFYGGFESSIDGKYRPNGGKWDFRILFAFLITDKRRHFMDECQFTDFLLRDYKASAQHLVWISARYHGINKYSFEWKRRPLEKNYTGKWTIYKQPPGISFIRILVNIECSQAIPLMANRVSIYCDQIIIFYGDFLVSVKSQSNGTNKLIAVPVRKLCRQ